MFVELLQKAGKGAERAGHKYLSRKPDGQGGFDYLYHTAAHHNVESIAAQGLQPRGSHEGASSFNHGGYAEHSAGKLFLSETPEAARAWHGKVADQLEAASDDPEEHVPVMLRVKPRKTQVDPIGDADVPGSVYTKKGIAPEDIEFWHPKHKGWRPLAKWGEDGTEVERGLQGRGDERRVRDKGGFAPDGYENKPFHAAPVQTAADKAAAAAKTEREARQAVNQAGAAEREVKYQKERGDEDARNAVEFRADPVKRQQLIDQAKKGLLPLATLDIVLDYGQGGRNAGRIAPSWQHKLKVDADGNARPGFSFDSIAKSVKGAEKTGHKYLSRKPDGKGGWTYEYVSADSKPKLADSTSQSSPVIEKVMDTIRGYRARIEGAAAKARVYGRQSHDSDQVGPEWHPLAGKCRSIAVGLAADIDQALGEKRARVVGGWFKTADKDYYFPSNGDKAYPPDGLRKPGEHWQEHWWVELNGVNIDVSADQFFPSSIEKQLANRIVIEPKADSRYHPFRRRPLHQTKPLPANLEALADKIVSMKSGRFWSVSQYNKAGVYRASQWLEANADKYQLSKQNIADLEATLEHENTTIDMTKPEDVRSLLSEIVD